MSSKKLAFKLLSINFFCCAQAVKREKRREREPKGKVWELAVKSVGCQRWKWLEGPEDIRHHRRLCGTIKQTKDGNLASVVGWNWHFLLTKVTRHDKVSLPLAARLFSFLFCNLMRDWQTDCLLFSVIDINSLDREREEANDGDKSDTH